MKNFNIRLIFSLMLFAICCTHQLNAQNKFQASAVLGMSASQLGGDSLSGYDKLGLTAGLSLSYDFQTKWDLTMELLYSQRGSRESVGFSNSGNNTTTLNYIEIPVYVTLNDWLIEGEDYYKVGVFAGLSYGYLISINTTNPILESRESEFKVHDISGRFGVFYAFNKNLIFRSYYTDSFINLVEGNLFNTNGLNSFFWTFRLDYSF